jgi:uroporphyrinogen-III synthase
MASVLSTKKLALNQKELLLNSGVGLVEYDAISIKFPDIQIKALDLENVIFTSKNAVKAIEGKKIEVKYCFCVGDKTSSFLRRKGYEVVEVAENSKELANILVKKYKHKEFHFFSGNKRRDELPEILKEHNIKFSETRVYETQLNPQKFDSEFDGILFFSPSAVQSFTAENKFKSSTAFCIGETTANEVGKHTNKIIIASRPAIENVIAKVVSNLKD